MDGGSTIGVPHVPIALPDVPHSACSEAQATSEGGGRVARCGWSRVILEGTLIDGARIGAGEALGALSGALVRGLVGGGRKTDGGEGETSSLSIHGCCGDGTRIGLDGVLLTRDTALTTKEVLEALAGDGSTSSVCCTGRWKRGRVAAGRHGVDVVGMRVVLIWGD